MRNGSASRVCPANTTLHGPLFRGRSYSFMFRPPSLLASRVVPTATGSPAGQLRLLHPSRTCIVAFARIGYAIRPTTGNWRSEDLHLARFTALSTAPLTLGVHSMFRHTLATDLLREGCSLDEIGELLRHRSPNTTAIYAKVDLVALRGLALPWLGGGQ